MISGTRKQTPGTTRRTLLTGGAAVTALALTAGQAHAGSAPRTHAGARLRELEARHGARVGAFAYNVATGASVRHRAAERFPICSLFKTVAAGAILRDLDRHGEVLAKRIHYTDADMVEENSPITSKPENRAAGMTVAELADAAIRYSDNTAGNLMLRELGGPRAITRFCRSLGDTRTRLDRWEPLLNTCEPWRVEDTTTPASLAGTYARLVLGDALNPADRERLTGWLLNNTTSDDRFRKGLPADWTVADKTGGGDYGTNNNAGIAWTPDGTPIVLAVLTTKPDPDAPADNPLVAAAAGILAGAVT
ncbi:class A beta-lactamase [Streptomyces sp. NPDC008313]|uniref:class A beta-lactamase n=1 Tax=Streptomyces sp. NPDC008313 TaxID=3364826 RepID=UPI0036ECE346